MHYYCIAVVKCVKKCGLGACSQKLFLGGTLESVRKRLSVYYNAFVPSLIFIQEERY